MENLAFVYLIHETSSHWYKLGCTGRAIQTRVSELQTGNPRPLCVTGLMVCQDLELARDHERQLHDLYAPQRGVGEWFTLLPQDVSAMHDYFQTVTEALPLLKAPAIHAIQEIMLRRILGRPDSVVSVQQALNLPRPVVLEAYRLLHD